MRTSSRGVRILVACLVGSSTAGAAPVCENGSQLWKWIENREVRVHARAQCEYQGQKAMVDAYGSRVAFISMTESSASLAESQMRDALMTDCARQLQSKTLSFLDIQKGALLTAPAPSSAETVSDLGFVYADAPINSNQALQIKNLLHANRSCSTFETQNSNGIIELSDCTMTGIDKEKITGLFSDAEFSGIIIGAIANFIRGGEQPFKFGNTQEARAAAAAVFATLPEVTDGRVDKQSLLKSLEIFFVGMGTFALAYQTHGFVNGGQSARHIGTSGPLEAIETSMIYNTIFNAALTQQVNAADVEGAAADTVFWLADGYLANNKYQIGGKLLGRASANSISELLTGAVAGYLIVTAREAWNKKHNMHTLKNFHNEMLLKLSSLDLCLDVRPILEGSNPSL